MNTIFINRSSKKTGFFITLLSTLIIVTICGNTRAGASTPYGNPYSYNTKAISMGGAFTSVSDIHNSLLWNPASIINKKMNSKYRKKSYVDLNLNGLNLFFGLVVGIALAEEGGYYDGSSTVAKGLVYIMANVIKSSTYISKKNFLISVNFQEDIHQYNDNFRDKLLHELEYNEFDNKYQTVSTGYGFTDEFAIGGTASFYRVYTNGAAKNGFGFSLSAHYNPDFLKDYHLGLTFFHFPGELEQVRYVDDRLANNSINIGNSYIFKDVLTASLDFRSIDLYKDPTFFEAHLGLEQKLNIYKEYNLYFREGLYFKENNFSLPVVSFGAGFKPGLFKKRSNVSLVIEAGCVYDKDRESNNFNIYGSGFIYCYLW
ncbi:MAG: hypothetical protein GY754_17095 [bacterium]|nr:hypothetical protein [bacterium]